MPGPDPDLVAPPVSVALEPAHNALNSLMVLDKVDHISGLDPWVTRTVAALTPEQRYTNHLVVFGLHYAVVPDRGWSSFPAYIDHLAAIDPVILRDRVFTAYAQVRKKTGEPHPPPDPGAEGVSLDVAPLLGSVDAFLELLFERFPEDVVEPELETESHRYLNDPPAMQELIVSHFRAMWEEILAPEWERALPMVQASLDAFRQIDFSELSLLEAFQRVVGRRFEEEHARYWEKAALTWLERLIFVPSIHMGPYTFKYRFGNTLWVLFGARVPEGVQGVYAPDLSRAELLVRLGALADDTRLRILKLISEEGERRSQDIMDRLELSQSATSRHLKQLSATGYLNERRCEGAKCYALNPQRVEDTLRAISAFLLGK